MPLNIPYVLRPLIIKSGYRLASLYIYRTSVADSIPSLSYSNETSALHERRHTRRRVNGLVCSLRQEADSMPIHKPRTVCCSCLLLLNSNQKTRALNPEPSDLQSSTTRKLKNYSKSLSIRYNSSNPYQK